MSNNQTQKQPLRARPANHNISITIDHDKSKEYGRRMYKYAIPNWGAVYKLFENIAYEILDAYGVLCDNTTKDDHEDINRAIEALYAQHKGEEAWDIAYRKWHEWDEEVAE